MAVHDDRLHVIWKNLRISEQFAQGIRKTWRIFLTCLDVAVINLHNIGREEELGNGFLYLKIQKIDGMNDFTVSSFGKQEEAKV